MSTLNYLDISGKYLLWGQGGLSFGSSHSILLPSLKGIHELITWLSTQNSLPFGEAGRKGRKQHSFLCSCLTFSCSFPLVLNKGSWLIGVAAKASSYIFPKHWILLTCEYSASPLHLSLSDHLYHFPLSPDQQSHWSSGISSNRRSAFQSCSMALAISPDRTPCMAYSFISNVTSWEGPFLIPTPNKFHTSFTTCFLCLPLLEYQLHEAENLACFVCCSNSNTKNSGWNICNYWMVE